MMEKRHTVRKYLDKPLDMDLIGLLNDRIERNNCVYNLTFKLITNNSDGLSSLARLMSNNSVQNYIILAGKDNSDLDKKIGYCGADLILYAQSLGLNTWWCGGMFNGKNALKHLDNKAVRVNGVIAIGYGKTQGVPHKSKTADQVSHFKGDAPGWFKSGIKALLLAPSALNRQPYIVNGEGNKVSLKVKSGTFSQVDLGIGKYFFELGAGKSNFEWEDTL
ncbi:nitroreductase [Holdemanella biformis]|nr:nitroreductase [Holdemanella biformis]MBV3417725.1 nitroreductase [Holdemanella biformis]